MFVITGGGSGIGRALAQHLAEGKKKVLIVGRREEKLKEVTAFSPLISCLAADISTEKGREQLVASLGSLQSIEGLIHNAGVISPITALTTINQASWEKTLATNLSGPLFLTQLLLDKLDQGRVLHIGSGAAYFPIMGCAAYCVSKAGLAMLTRCWQLESHSPAFASVMPGIIDTEMQAAMREANSMDPKDQGFYKSLQSEGRLLSSDTVAVFLRWLLLDIDAREFSSKEWDIYDKSHHQRWLVTPHKVPHWE